MRIVFTLPGYATRPWGGFKVVYEYANRLAALGHHVSVVHPRNLVSPESLSDRVKSYLWGAKIRLRDRPIVPWFPISKAVDVRLVRTLDKADVQRSDVVVATAWQTARAVCRLQRHGVRVMYFVQDVEFWETAPPEVRSEIEGSFRLGMPMVAVSPAAAAMIRTAGVDPVATITSGIDRELFHVTIRPEDRPGGAIGFPFREMERKGSQDALEAMELLRARFGDAIEAATFGTGLPASLPGWIRRCESPSDSELAHFYNSISVFVFPSHNEAWGLPGLEAMACGAALVAADNDGVRGYANTENAILVPPRRPDLLANAVQQLVSDPTLRRSLATRGLARARSCEWNAAVERFEALLKGRE